jgi:hypothetical protein
VWIVGIVAGSLVIGGGVAAIILSHDNITINNGKFKF